MGVHFLSPQLDMAVNNMESDSAKPTPEQVKAIGVLEKNLPRWKDGGCRWETTYELHQDDIAFFKGHLTTKNILHDKHWYWNQTKARRKHTVRVTGEMVYYWKIIPRRAKKLLRDDVVLPLTRVWVYHITIPSGEVDYSPPVNATMVWCQQGSVEISSVPYEAPTERKPVSNPLIRKEIKPEPLYSYPSEPTPILGVSVTIKDFEFLRGHVPPHLAAEWWDS